MTDAKPFSDEELEGLKQIKVHRPTEIAVFGDKRISYDRFLATIAARDTTIQQQATTIERLRIATECIETITCEDDKMIKNPKTGKWEEDQNWSFVYRIVHVATARCKADHSDWEKEMMEFYEGYVKRSGSEIVDPLGHKTRQLDTKEEK